MRALALLTLLLLSAPPGFVKAAPRDRLASYTSAELQTELAARRSQQARAVPHTPPGGGSGGGGGEGGGGKGDPVEPLPDVGGLKYLSYYECCGWLYNMSSDSACPAPDEPNEKSAGGGLHGTEAGLNLGLSSYLPAILKAHRCFGKASLFQIDGAHGINGPPAPTALNF